MAGKAGDHVEIGWARSAVLRRAGLIDLPDHLLRDWMTDYPAAAVEAIRRRIGD